MDFFSAEGDIFLESQALLRNKRFKFLKFLLTTRPRSSQTWDRQGGLKIYVLKQITLENERTLHKSQANGSKPQYTYTLSTEHLMEAELSVGGPVAGLSC